MNYTELFSIPRILIANRFCIPDPQNACREVLLRYFLLLSIFFFFLSFFFFVTGDILLFNLIISVSLDRFDYGIFYVIFFFYVKW